MKKVIVIHLMLLMVGSLQLLAQQQQKDVEKRIDEIICQLTLEEKVKMCHAQSKFSSPGVERLGIPEIWMSDGPHGVRAEIEWDSWNYAGWTNDSCTAFPALTCLASTFNPELAYKYGVAIGEEARYRKKDILLGPGVNIYRTPLNGRNFEYMGEDPYLASVMCVPYIQGVQANGVAACVKHYALNNQEVWRGHINVKVSDRALHEIYLPAFKAAVKDGEVWSVMGAYNQYNGQHTSHHKVLINDILKGDWAFDGVVVTDWGSAHDTKEAALNGLDIEMGTGTDGLTSSTENAYDYYYLAKPFLEMLKSGEIDESVVDDKVRRILRLMFRTNMSKARPLGRKANQEHFDVAREVAQEGIVLLKNHKSFLPLDPETTQTIAVIGENATRMMTIGGGSSELKTVHEISPLEGIQKRFAKANIIHSMGYASGPSAYGRVIPSHLDTDSLKQAAIQVAKEADIVLFVGGLNKNHEQDCENGDRKSLNLPFGQDELLSEIMAVNNHVGVVLVSGNAVAMPWQAQAKAIVQAWYLGSETGHALADVLSGDVNPSGKLPFTFPVKLEDNGAHAFDALSYPGDGVDQVYKEDILVGYRWHDTKQIKPLYAFGHGLSYTSFKIHAAEVESAQYQPGDAVQLSVNISNTGKQAGAEVLQVYVHDSKAAVMRPLKELKAFRKVKLAPGESKLVEFSIPVDSFAYYDEDKEEWHLEAGQFKLMVGTSSQDIRKTLPIEVK
ncbi:glycoside hydrolase family 3 C-terminal domain-containing protein [Carboxylicivirga mesophila]|uniref:Glycoside hydrolase family 3 C-terminal domain-containing protein n=1 Tax=Carboxylicivirga mesophila TaxID=1166478 RepID=A0ABS5K971_9BACT|nr:glycoside hydrolase family 3 C-terminal domain-containing protein [Carboxylicivirga mesophila]MBS2211427.1 glycoside hydrolase family 3 C-terminal domain-containing protein [Carboxylicivirga mesophila]